MTTEWELPDGYAAIRDGVAWHGGEARSLVTVVGEDAVRFLDGFTTASVAGLGVGEGTVGFFPDARGQVLAVATIYRAADGVWIDSDPPRQASNSVPAASDTPADWSLTAHLDRFHIRERLRLADESAAVAFVLVAGPQAGAWLAGVAEGRLPERAFAHDLASLEDWGRASLRGRLLGVPAAVARGEWAGPGSLLVMVARSDHARLVTELEATGLPAASAAAVDAVRREEGWPSAADLTPRTLPQELGRDRQAISFRKGCYLGQETVARLDALGHVNRRLVGIVTSRDMPLRAGMHVRERNADGSVGMITTAGPSPRHDGWLGLSLVKVSSLRPETRLEADGQPARWVPLPPSGS
jgi:folate-binding protein YgfZ